MDRDLRAAERLAAETGDDDDAARVEREMIRAHGSEVAAHAAMVEAADSRVSAARAALRAIHDRQRAERAEMLARLGSCESCEGTRRVSWVDMDGYGNVSDCHACKDRPDVTRAEGFPEYQAWRDSSRAEVERERDAIERLDGIARDLRARAEMRIGSRVEIYNARARVTDKAGTRVPVGTVGTVRAFARSNYGRRTVTRACLALDDGREAWTSADNLRVVNPLSGPRERRADQDAAEGLRAKLPRGTRVAAPLAGRIFWVGETRGRLRVGIRGEAGETVWADAADVTPA